MMDIISFIFGIAFSTNVIQGLSDGTNLYYIHSKDNTFYYMDRYEIKDSSVVINRQIVSLTDVRQSLDQGRYYFIDKDRKDAIKEASLEGINQLKKTAEEVFKTERDIWQEDAMKRLPPKIKKDDIKWTDKIDVQDDYLWDDKSGLAIIQLKLFYKNTTDINGIPIGVNLHGYCLYDAKNKRPLTFYLLWEVEWYD
jgi:hypothetical protein